MGRVGFRRHFGNNNVVFLRRIYGSTRQFVSKSLQNARNMSCWRLQQYWIRRIEYSSSFNTSIPMKLDQKREKDQRSGLICAKQKSRSRRGFFDLWFAATVKTYSFSWPVHSSLSLVESLTFSWYCMGHELGIRWKPSDLTIRSASDGSSQSIT